MRSICRVSCETVSVFGAADGGADSALARRVSFSRNSKKSSATRESRSRPAPRGTVQQRLHQQAELHLVVLVRHLVLVERVHLDLLLAGQMIVHAVDRARRADVVPQAVADDGAA